MEELATMGDVVSRLPDTFDSSDIVGGLWFMPDQVKNDSLFSRNFLNFEYDFKGLQTVGSVDLENITSKDLGLMLQYNAYELFMLRALGTVALVFAMFVCGVKFLRGFRNRIKSQNA